MKINAGFGVVFELTSSLHHTVQLCYHFVLFVCPMRCITRGIFIVKIQGNKMKGYAPSSFNGLVKFSALVGPKIILDSKAKTDRADDIQDSVTSVFTLISFQALHCT